MRRNERTTSRETIGGATSKHWISLRPLSFGMSSTYPYWIPTPGVRAFDVLEPALPPGPRPARLVATQEILWLRLRSLGIARVGMTFVRSWVMDYEDWMFE